MTKTRKMVNLDIRETSGVDHPAHQHEGWIVMKSASPETVGSLFGSLNKPEEAPVAEKTEAEKLAEANARIAELEAAAAAPAAGTQEPAAEPAGTQATEGSESGHEPAEATQEDALEKALTKLPEAVRKAFSAQAAELAKATETINKERDARLDGEAIAKSKGLFKAIAIDHDTVAPALRRVALVDADLAKAVETALSAADAQLASGTSLTKEVGNGGAGEGDNGALETINKAAAALREEDPKLSEQQAFVKALTANPSLHAAYIAEKAGK